MKISESDQELKNEIGTSLVLCIIRSFIPLLCILCCEGNNNKSLLWTQMVHSHPTYTHTYDTLKYILKKYCTKIGASYHANAFEAWM